MLYLHYQKLGKFTKFQGHNYKSFRNDFTLKLRQEKCPLPLTLRFTSIKVLNKVQQKSANIKPLKLGQCTDLTVKKWLQYIKV